MDALSDVLQTIKLSGVIFLRANLGDQYGVIMPPATLSHPLIKPETDEHRLVMFHIVREGEGYVEVENAGAHKLREGDLILVFDDLHHSVMDQPGRAAIPSANMIPDFALSAAPPAAEVGKGDPTMRLVCGMLQFVERGLNPVFSALPPFLIIPRDEGPESTWLRSCIDHIVREAESGRPGSETLLSRLTELLFVETLRTYLEKLPEDQRGWFAALKDPCVGAALQLMHESPAHPWTVGELARRVAVSRSAFSARFTELLDLSPIAYLARWRIRIASNLLESTQKSIAEVANEIGYESESAFNRAFKREMGLPPATWRKRRIGETGGDA